MKLRTHYPTLYFPWDMAACVSVPVLLSSMSLSEGVVNTADGFGRDPTRALGTVQIPDLYDARPTRTLTKSTTAITRYLRERVGDGEDESSVVATGS